MTADDQDEREKRAVEELLASSQHFTGIENVHVELGEDHTGEPSMWLVFKMRPDLQADADWVKAFSEYSTRLGLKIMQAGLQRFPYTRLERAA